MIDLQTPVQVRIPNDDRVIWQPAVIVGRTLEREPRYDVRLEDGVILPNIAGESVKVAA